MKVGYARVSSKSQNLSRQIVRLKKAGCNKIFTDKISGAKSKRPALHKMLSYIHDDDIVVFTSVDRIARKMSITRRIIDIIQNKNAKLNILAFPKLNTSNKTINKMLTNLMIEILSWEAETERQQIKARQKQGIAIAKKNGKYKGGKTKFHKDDDTTQKAIHALNNRKSNGLSSTQIARLYGMSRSELYYLKRKFNK